MGVSGVDGLSVGLAYDRLNDLLYGSSPKDLLEIDRDGSSYNNIGGGVGVEGLTYDPIRDVLYAVTDGDLFTLNRSDGLIIDNLAGAGFDAEGLAVDTRTGMVYAIGNSTLLKSYDPDTDTWTTVGDTGLNWDSGGLAYDPQRKRLYACGTNQGTVLYRINPNTAVAEAIGDSGVQLEGGLAFASGVLPIEPALPPGLPADEDIVGAESEITTDE